MLVDWKRLGAAVVAGGVAGGMGGGPARADLPLIGPGGIPVVRTVAPAPLPQVTGRLTVVWDGGDREATVYPPPGERPETCPAGTLAWYKVVPEIGNAVILLEPARNPTGWVVHAALRVDDGPHWVVPAQEWKPGSNLYACHLNGDPTTVAVARIDIGPE